MVSLYVSRSELISSKDVVKPTLNYNYIEVILIDLLSKYFMGIAFLSLAKQGGLKLWLALSIVVMIGSPLQAAEVDDSIATTSRQLSTLELHPYELHYGANYSGLSLNLDSSLEFNNGGYVIKQISKTFMAEIIETSRFKLVEGIIYPEQYSYRRNIFGIKKAYGTRYDYERGLATYTEVGDNKVRQIKLPAVVFDYINYPIQLRRDLIKYGKDYPQTTYQIERKGKLINYTFRFVREEIVDTDLGKLKTIVLEKIDDEDHILMWMATDWEYVITKLSSEFAGEEINLERGKVNGVAINGL
ncbi:MAG: DUF3108 domain-containing protein [Spongiibacteraceae bacterium]